MALYKTATYESDTGKLHRSRHNILQKRYSALSADMPDSAATALAHDLASHLNQYTDDRNTSDGQLIST